MTNGGEVDEYVVAPHRANGDDGDEKMPQWGSGGGSGSGGEGRVHEAWRTVALMLAGMLGTGFGAWAMFDRDQPTRTEVQKLVDQEVKPIAVAMTAATTRLEKLADETATTRDRFNHLLGRLETIVGEHRGGGH